MAHCGNIPCLDPLVYRNDALLTALLRMCGAPFYKECQTRLLNLCKTHCVPTASPVGLFWTCVIYCRPIIDSFPWLGGEYNTPLILISGCLKNPIFPQTPYRGQPA